jgi:hypothetical protein
MPPLAADPNPWHLSAATFCVGPSEYPGRFEWELRSGASWAILDSVRPVHYYIPTLQKRTRETGPALFATPVSFVRNRDKQSPSPHPPGRRSYNLGTTTTNLEHPPLAQVHLKTGAPTPVRDSRLSFEWIVPGFTAVCFWDALRLVPPKLYRGAGLLIAALEGPVR